MIFGTDFPVLDFEKTTADIDGLDLRPAALRKLMRDNVIKLYKLDARGVSFSEG